VAAASVAQSGDLILTLGAGNISQLAPQILEALETQPQRAVRAGVEEAR